MFLFLCSDLIFCIFSVLFSFLTSVLVQIFHLHIVTRESECLKQLARELLVSLIKVLCTRGFTHINSASYFFQSVCTVDPPSASFDLPTYNKRLQASHRIKDVVWQMSHMPLINFKITRC